MGTLEYDFSEETVIVTGGASGIGRAIAQAFGAAGATVLIADVREEPKDAGTTTPTHETIRGAGGTAAFVATDVTDPDAVAAVVEATREYGGVDVMVNNAGLFVPGRLVEFDLGDLDRILGVNVRGVFAGCQAAARDMHERDDPGCIVNTASISSTVAQENQIAYDASKGAVRMITRGAALELAPEIRVNGVAPGIIATEFGYGAEAVREDVRAGEMQKPVPMGRAGASDEIAPTALFLASDDASYVTGELVHVDGGWRAL